MIIITKIKLKNYSEINLSQEDLSILHILKDNTFYDFNILIIFQ